MCMSWDIFLVLAGAVYAFEAFSIGFGPELVG